MKQLLKTLLTFGCYLALSTSLFAQENLAVLLIENNTIGNNGYDELSFKALANIKVKYNLDYSVLVVTKKGRLNTKFIKQIADTKPKIMIASSRKIKNYLKKITPDYPDTIFILNDEKLTEGQQDLAQNVTYLSYNEKQGAYLAGLLAAKVSQSKKIAIIAGSDEKAYQDLRNGFYLGANAGNPDVRVYDTTIRPFDARLGNNRPDLAFKLANKLFKEGVDIIFAIASDSNRGVLVAAKKIKKQIILTGANLDHTAKGIVLVSVVKRIDKALYLQLEKIETGSANQTIAVFDLKQKGIALSDMLYTNKKLTPKISLAIKEHTEQIISKKITLDRRAMRDF